MHDVELKTDAEYAAALQEIDRLLDQEPEKGSPGHDQLQQLQALVEAYELKDTRAADRDELPVPGPEAE